ncbi:putative O-methyltransferase YrrM [Thiogranum longum]|uniref:Putative O-methyltransferase YrrM n=1 Tax=Thiogranum longum TaxID=1537524 RepID=A0A4R1HEH2_9GAMM|nr:class I SAM-dependent methyltransferase [Thiogranum longum]TCK18715.1 putative O-methyltransferase YrrM [Thiogranum longum]
MSNKTFTLPDALYDYLQAVSLREDPLLQRLREETANDAMSVMQIAPEQGQFMALLVRLMGARKALEIGTYTGYSALCVARVLPDDGTLVACDISEPWTAIGKRYWREAGVSDKIDLRLAPALETLDQLIQAGETGHFDFAFIDADKENYLAYYERALTLLRPGGLMAIDNTLWSGSVIDDSCQDTDTCAIRAFNEALHTDTRVDISLVPIADGLTLALVR